MPGCSEDSIAQSGRGRDCANLPQTTRRLGALDDLNDDLRCLIQSQLTIIIEIVLLHLAVPDGDTVIERRGETEEDASLHLRNNAIRIDGHTTIDNSRDFLERNHPNVVQLYLDDNSGMTTETIMDRDAPAASRRKRCDPV